MAEVSIVLPTHNGEKFIRESIDSILSQTFTEWELVIVNDGSTDGTHEIIKDYIKSDSRIRLINNLHNIGLPATLNIGFRNTKGKYLTWTSDDNMYFSSALYIMKKFLDENMDYPMVCTGMICVDEDKRILSEHVKYNSNEMYLSDMVGACFLYRKEVVDEVGEYDEGLFCSEDYDYWVRILKKYGKIGFVDCVEYVYRYQSRSLTATRMEDVKKKNRILYFRNFEWIYNGIKNDLKKVFRLYNELICVPLYSESEEVAVIKSDYKVLAIEGQLRDGKDNIFFGAGNIGRATLKYLEKKPLYFADSDPEVVGQYIDGVEVISFEELINLLDKNDDYNVIITAGYEKQVSMVESLVNNGVNSYTFYSRICGDKVW